MNKRSLRITLLTVLTASLLYGCGKNVTVLETPADTQVGETVTQAPVDASKDTGVTTEDAAVEAETPKAAIEDGTYLASFDTDSTMFHVNEAWNGKGVLSVKNGEMTIHIVMPSKNVLNLYYGLAEDAAKDGAVLIDPTVEEVTYDDGMTEEVFAFDVPVPVLDEEYDVALIGKKEVWYDHKVKVSGPEPWDGSSIATGKTEESGSEADGELKADVTLTGGSGRASVTSPAPIREENGVYIATIEWSSPYYDYMIVDGQRYEPVNTEGNSVFEIPIPGFDQDITVIADTVAMSTPHEIEYVLNFTR